MVGNGLREIWVGFFIGFRVTPINRSGLSTQAQLYPCKIAINDADGKSCGAINGSQIHDATGVEAARRLRNATKDSHRTKKTEGHFDHTETT